MAKTNTWCKKLMHKAKTQAVRQNFGNYGRFNDKSIVSASRIDRIAARTQKIRVARLNTCKVARAAASR